MVTSLLQNEKGLESPSSATQSAAEKQNLDNTAVDVEELSPRNLHGVKVSLHSHRRNTGRSR